MKLSSLTHAMMRKQTEIEELERTLDQRRRSLSCDKILLGKALVDRTEPTNYPMTILIPGGYEIRVSDELFEVESSSAFSVCMTVQRSPSIPTDGLARLMGSDEVPEE